ncbi:hypothetical protein EAI_10353 [Harpegnathos saltator]|uniref:Uncharacterized protein n=1 Tax=Harpegnathos saltator TaxID=610380 RepID=E2C4S6_HARSA|nr:hypothetical protein EAI_10353 [Harpegnathos saltator]
MVSQRGKTEDRPVKKTSKDSTHLKQPPLKKRKLYTENIVMQKTTFDGLKTIAKCIDVRYEHLQSVAALVNNCKCILISELELNLMKKDINEDFVKQTLTAKYREIEENVADWGMPVNLLKGTREIKNIWGGPKLANILITDNGKNNNRIEYPRWQPRRHPGENPPTMEAGPKDSGGGANHCFV